MLFAMLALGLSIGGCAPGLHGSGESGGTIGQFQLLPGANELGAEAMAANYCSQYGRSAHIASEDLGLLWSSTYKFDCVN
jgi:hypothetical protein